MNPVSKKDIIEAINLVYQELFDQIEVLDNKPFELEVSGKWSIGEQLNHLILSSKPVASALNLPKITFRAFGIPTNDSRSYNDLVKDYQAKLADGGKATSKYIPSLKSYDKQQLLASWLTIGQKLVDRVNKSWSEEQLDRYLVPHPLLGKLTIREMLYFTIYHTTHHQHQIIEISKKASTT